MEEERRLKIEKIEKYEEYIQKYESKADYSLILALLSGMIAMISFGDDLNIVTEFIGAISGVVSAGAIRSMVEAISKKTLYEGKKEELEEQSRGGR